MCSSSVSPSEEFLPSWVTEWNDTELAHKSDNWIPSWISCHITEVEEPSENYSKITSNHPDELNVSFLVVSSRVMVNSPGYGKDSLSNNPHSPGMN